MPAWMPEGNVTLPSDDEMRSAAKWAQLLVNQNGNRSSPYPEGCIPLPGDDEQKLYHKVNRLKE